MLLLVVNINKTNILPLQTYFMFKIFFMMAFVENIIYNENDTDVILQIKRKNGAQYIEDNKIAAITIQRYYKGYYTRLYFSKINFSATIIQKHWKGYIARR